MKVVLCDDQITILDLYRETLYTIAEREEIPIQILEYKSGEELLFDLEDRLGGIDLMYLDVEMPGLNGIELGKKLRTKGYLGEIIYLTSYRDFVFDSFEVHPNNYLLKDEVTRGKYEKTFLEVVEQRKHAKNQFFQCKNKSGIINIRTDEIRCFEVIKRIIFINYKEFKYQFYGTFEKLQLELDKEMFIRVHRGYIVNITWVKCVKRTEVELITGEIIPVGRRYLAQVREMFDKHLYGEEEG